MSAQSSPHPRRTVWRVTARRAAALCALVVLALGASSCRKERWETEDPKAALKLFVAAVFYNNTSLAWRLITPDAQSALEGRASTLNATLPETAHIEPASLLSSAGFIGPHTIAKIEREGDPAASNPDQGRFALTVHDGRSWTVAMRRVEGVWRVELPELPDPAAEPAAEPEKEAPVPASPDPSAPAKAPAGATDRPLDTPPGEAPSSPTE